MIKEAFGKGATTEAAIEDAIANLNAPAGAEVKTEITKMPEKKFLGIFGGSVAEARAYYEESPVAKACEYIKNVLNGMGISDVKIDASEEDGTYVLNIECGEQYGAVIGRRGETLDALQYLASLVANRGSEEYLRISLNVGTYREKRENTLRSLARKNAQQILKYGRNIVLEPMNPYERRIIHTTIQEIEGVNSHSVGSDNERRVVITLADGVEPTNPGGYRGRGGYNNRGRNGRYNNNRGGNRGGRYNDRYNDRRQNSEPAAPARPPRKDADAAPLYGKIERKAD